MFDTTGRVVKYISSCAAKHFLSFCFVLKDLAMMFTTITADMAMAMQPQFLELLHSNLVQAKR